MKRTVFFAQVRLPTLNIDNRKTFATREEAEKEIAKISAQIEGATGRPIPEEWISIREIEEPEPA